jgi:hypothetical protein
MWPHEAARTTSKTTDQQQRCNAVAGAVTATWQVSPVAATAIRTAQELRCRWRALFQGF